MNNKENLKSLAGFGLSPELIETALRAIENHNRETLIKIIQQHHAADIADLIQALTPDERRELVKLLRGHIDPEVFAELEEWARDDILEVLDVQQLVEAIKGLEGDDALALLEDLAPRQQHKVLQYLPQPQRRSLEKCLTYPKKSAGRLMQPEVISMPLGATVADLRAHLAQGIELPGAYYEVFLVDSQNQPQGRIPLHTVLSASDATLLEDLMDRRIYSILATTDQEEVANLFRQYGLISAPVVDNQGHLIGMITVDDVVEVLNQEAVEDILHLGGVQEGDFFAPIFETSFTRLRWLLATFVNSILASSVIYQFQSTIENHVALAVLMPIVAAMGGNAGMQVVTITVRALATHQLGLRPSSMIWALGKELRVGMMNGLVFATILSLGVSLYFGDWHLGFVLAFAMVFNIIWAGVAGTVIPLFLAKIKIDPAIAAGPLLTTTTDILGFAVFLGLATWILL